MVVIQVTLCREHLPFGLPFWSPMQLIITCPEARQWLVCRNDTPAAAVSHVSITCNQSYLDDVSRWSTSRRLLLIGSWNIATCILAKVGLLISAVRSFQQVKRYKWQNNGSLIGGIFGLQDVRFPARAIRSVSCLVTIALKCSVAEIGALDGQTDGRTDGRIVASLSAPYRRWGLRQH